MKSRETGPDWVKGVAIVLMVYGHTRHVGMLADMQVHLVKVIYTFHMPLFLLISGFFFKAPLIDSSASAKRLMNRLIVPYLAFSSIYLLGLLAVQRTAVIPSTSPPTSLVGFFEILLFSPRGAYWFVHSVILIQGVFLIAALISRWLKWNEVTYLCASVFFLAMVSNFGLIAPRTVLYFLVGLALNRSGLGLPAAVAAGASMILLISFLAWEKIFNLSLVQLAWCLSILAFLVGSAQALRSSVLSSVFSWLGRNSLVILMLHAMFTVSLKSLAAPAVKVDSTGLMYSLLVVLVAIIGSMAVAVLLDNMCISRYLFGVDSIYSRLSEVRRAERPLAER